MNKTLLLSAAAMMSASVAVADPWNGVYVGMSLGSNSWTHPSNTPVTEVNTLLSVGYNAQIGSMVVGVEAHYGDVAYSDTSTDTRSGTAFRAGYLLTPGTLGYATIGNSDYVADTKYEFVGFGAEFAAFGSATADIEYREYSNAVTNWSGSEISLGLNWHF